MAPPSFPAIAGCFLFHAALNQASPIVGSNSYVPASNAVQTSIIKQQIYNLCLFEHSLNLCNETCKPYGTLTLTPVQVIASLTEGSGYGTFVASPLTEYAGLQHPTTILTSDGYGIPTTLPIGELGQVWSKLGGDFPCEYPNTPPPPPICTVGGSHIVTNTGALSTIGSTGQPSSGPQPSSSVPLSIPGGQPSLSGGSSGASFSNGGSGTPESSSTRAISTPTTEPSDSTVGIPVDTSSASPSTTVTDQNGSSIGTSSPSSIGSPPSFVTTTGANGQPTVIPISQSSFITTTDSNGAVTVVPVSSTNPSSQPSFITTTGSNGVVTVISATSSSLQPSLITTTDSNGLTTVIPGPSTIEVSSQPSLITTTDSNGVVSVIPPPTGVGSSTKSSFITTTDSNGAATVIPAPPTSSGSSRSLITTTDSNGAPTVIPAPPTSPGSSPSFITTTGSNGEATVIPAPPTSSPPSFITTTGSNGVVSVIPAPPTSSPPSFITTTDSKGVVSVIPAPPTSSSPSFITTTGSNGVATVLPASSANPSSSSIQTTDSNGASTVKPVPSTSPSIPPSNAPSSSEPSNTAGAAPADRLTISSETTVIDGATTVIPVIIGGPITSAIPVQAPAKTTIVPTGTEAQSSASSLSTELVGLFPIISIWITNPEPPAASAVIKAIEDIIPNLVNLLDELPTDLTSSTNCGSKRRRMRHKRTLIEGRLKKRGLFSSLFDLISSIICTVTDIVKDVEKNLVDDIKTEISNLQTEIDNLDDETKENSSSGSQSPSSTSCTSKSTTEDIYVQCSPTQTVGPAGTSTTLTCSTSTSTVSGCDLTAFTTTTTASSSSSHIHLAKVVPWTSAFDGGIPLTAVGGDAATSLAAQISQFDATEEVDGSSVSSSPVTTAPSTTTAPSIHCIPGADPDEGINAFCQCDGIPGRFVELPSTTSPYSPCAYTTTPTETATPVTVAPPPGPSGFHVKALKCTPDCTDALEIVPDSKNDCGTIAENQQEWWGAAFPHPAEDHTETNADQIPPFSLLSSSSDFDVLYVFDPSSGFSATLCGLPKLNFTFTKTDGGWVWLDTDNASGTCTDTTGSSSDSCDHNSHKYTAQDQLYCVNTNNPGYCAT